jgi:mannose-6-phosphate isomerase-like protein (cupin superfamily)
MPGPRCGEAPIGVFAHTVGWRRRRRMTPCDTEGAPMAEPYTLTKLAEVEDSAVKFGMGDVQEARFATDDLEAEHTGVSYHRVKPGKRQAFAHRHEGAEEVYVVLAGRGRIKLDDDIVAIERLDAIRVSPTVIRSFEGGPEGLEVLAFGPRLKGDGEIIADWWTD